MLSRIFIGTLSGGCLSAACFAIFSWIVIYNSDPGTGVEGPFPEWAHLAAMMGAVIGAEMGLLLGLAISLLNRGLIVGTVLGFLGGLVLLILMSRSSGHPDIIYPTVPLIISFLPAGALSGFLTSLGLRGLERVESPVVK